MSGAPSVRLFLGLWPTPDLRARLAAIQEACAWPAGAAVVAAPRLHVTLHFIGAVPGADLGRVQAELALPQVPAFELGFGRTEIWPRGLAVLMPLVVPDALQVLHGALAAALTRLGLPVEARPYRPHVTLARRAAGARLAQPEQPFTWQVQSYALIESRPGPGGGYVVLRRYS